MVQQSTINFLKDWERVAFKAYDDGFGYLTIGIGHKIEPQEGYLKTATIDMETVMKLFKQDYGDLQIAKHMKKITVAINQNQFDALCSFIWTLGYLPKSIVQLVNEQSVIRLKKKWMAYTYSTDKTTKVKKRVLGLYRRRLAETDLYFGQYKGRNFYDTVKLPA